MTGGWGRGGWIRGKKGRGKADADVNMKQFIIFSDP
jgi:hypothetical protein